MKNKSIVVTGDVCINTLQWVLSPSYNQGYNWQKHKNVKTTSKGGEALLLADLVRFSTDISVLSPALDTVQDLILSSAQLELYPKYGKDGQEKVYRVSCFLGFTGPIEEHSWLLPVENDDPSVDLIIIDDENNGFNMNRKFWPMALDKSEHDPIVLYKMNKPAGSSELWYHLEQNHKEKTVVIINSEDIRSQGVNISKSLSWEKTAEDFVWQLNNNPSLTFLTKCSHLVVPFGLEGCIYYRNEGQASKLFFLPYEIEGGFKKRIQGNMYGLTSCFVAAIARSMVVENNGIDELQLLIGEGIKEGIVAAQNYFIEGFGSNLDQLHFPIQNIFHENYPNIIIKEHVQEVNIPEVKPKNSTYLWTILNDKSSTSLAEIAYDIVKNGPEKALRYIPIAKFGNLKTVDRTEIESYRSIKNLMREYIDAENTVRPLSVAVFGTPGAGKSFGLTEVATSIAPDQIIKLTLNLSQFQSISDLIKAFHRSRDYTLKGKIPLLIFDEFDSDFQGRLGWIKYLLAPMQDGVFRDGDREHPIGKAIFVFAGGTSSTFYEFVGESIENQEERKKFEKDFRYSKGLDFISRLRGYVNILGPNPSDESDGIYVIRRAMLLRSLIERKIPHIINDAGETQIDNGVLRAMLKVPKFKHETRSIEAIVDMSMLNKAKKWEQSHLPSKEQLMLHVDEEQFMRHLMHDAFFSEKIEELATYLFIQFNKIENEISSWENANEEQKNFYMDLARNIPDAFLFVNYDVVSVKEKPTPIVFVQEELENLAKYEHTRWLLHKKNRGWNYHDTFDMQEKTDPYIVSYNLLPAKKQEQIIEFVKTWSKALAQVNYTLTR